jgi:uncharacterized protein (TIGR02001 family)
MIAAVCALSAASAATFAQDAAKAPSICTKLDLAYVSKYIWRGIPLNPDPAVQPSLTFTHPSGVSLNVWGSMDTTDVTDQQWNVTEIDYTLNYQPNPNIYGGLVSYTFPNTEFPTTSEVYACYCFLGKYSPALSVNYDIDKSHGIYAAASAGYSCAIPGQKRAPAVGLSARIGYGDSRHNRYNYLTDTSGLTDVLIGAALPITVTPKITVTPSISYASIINSDIKKTFDASSTKKNNFVYGVTVSFPL